MQFFEKDICFSEPDLHSDIHLIVVLSGSLRIRNDNEFLQLRPGDFVLTAPWVLHGSNTMTGGTRLFVLTIETAALLEHMLCQKERLLSLLFCPEALRKKCLSKCSLSPFVKKLLQSFETCEQEEETMRTMRRWLAIQTFFVDLLSGLTNSDFPVVSTEKFRKIEPSLTRISEGKALSVHEAAALCRLSVSYFTHLFKETMGVSFSVYEMRSRMNHAAIRLQQGIPVKEAAEEFSFFDSSHFSKIFNKSQQFRHLHLLHSESALVQQQRFL